MKSLAVPTLAVVLCAAVCAAALSGARPAPAAADVADQAPTADGPQPLASGPITAPNPLPYVPPAQVDTVDVYADPAGEPVGPPSHSHAPGVVCESCLAQSPIQIEAETIAGARGHATVRVRVLPDYPGASRLTVRLMPLDGLVVDGPDTVEIDVVKGEWCSVAFAVSGAAGSNPVVIGARERFYEGRQSARTLAYDVVLP